MHLLDCFWVKWPWNWKSIQMTSKNDETWHAVIISPTWYVVKVWEDYEKKLDTLRLQTGPFLSKYQGFDRKQPHYKDTILFLNPLNPKLFMCSTVSIHTNILKFQTFLTSFDKFIAFNELFLSKMTVKLKINSNDF